MVNDTHDCAAKCNQGSGSPADTKAYSDCVQSCISSHFYSGSPATPKPASGSASAGSAAATGSATGIDLIIYNRFNRMLTSVQVPAREPSLPVQAVVLLPIRLLLKLLLQVLPTACKSVPRSPVLQVSWQLSLPCKWIIFASISGRREG
jgi:hypothetical protein